MDVNEYTIKDIMAEAAADLGDASLLPNLEVWDERFPGDRHIRTQLRRLQIKVGQAKHQKTSK